MALTVAAEATTDLRVGSLVLGNDYRHPVVLAKEVATLDLLSEGRVEFGLGAGWMTSDYEQSGIPNDSPGTRIDRMAESLAIMKALWSEGRATLAGKHYNVTEAVGTPIPHQRPYPPIIIGGGGKRVLTLAAREADIVGINPNLAAGYIGPEVAAESDQLEFQCWTAVVQVVPNGREVLEQMAPLLSTTPEALAEIPIALVGTVDEIVETLQRRREELGFSYIVIQEAEIDAFAPVVARLTGT